MCHLKKYFDPWLVESTDVEPMDTEGQLYILLYFYRMKIFLDYSLYSHHFLPELMDTSYKNKKIYEQ